jgi:hypothetical protein
MSVPPSKQHRHSCTTQQAAHVHHISSKQKRSTEHCAMFCPESCLVSQKWLVLSEQRSSPARNHHYAREQAYPMLHSMPPTTHGCPSTPHPATSTIIEMRHPGPPKNARDHIQTRTVRPPCVSTCSCQSCLLQGCTSAPRRATSAADAGDTRCASCTTSTQSDTVAAGADLHRAQMSKGSSQNKARSPGKRGTSWSRRCTRAGEAGTAATSSSTAFTIYKCSNKATKRRARCSWFP